MNMGEAGVAANTAQVEQAEKGIQTLQTAAWTPETTAQAVWRPCVNGPKTVLFGATEHH